MKKAWEETVQDRKYISMQEKQIDEDLVTLNQTLAEIDTYYEEDEEAEYTESNPKWKLIIPKHFMDPENLTSDLGPKHHPPFPVVPTAAMMDPSTRMRESACRGRTWEVIELIEQQGAQVELERRSVGCADIPPFHVPALIERGGNISQVTRHGRTPLHYAADQGHLECARVLLNAGADTNLRDIDDRTPLQLAKNAGHVAVMELLGSVTNNSTEV
ncbi:hypothetical protein GUITHDRAFT_101089 [Guillardia theta CCMP2712]|uniref:Uncharacterized protein n=1 Tax=Guillardia theta (strain CCMP2712) TaxID=905079 RepID=L1JXU4_GUITC|nr:hypothetical protein GUITHDRAFT_122597 [Guillardia theta CCMP2712]XP_005840366.1 hypothetical protein GUITHDRAFT_101089 [Guillardia theta CCMP2712]EKX31200.1 hypothetical protein GUITHDRAFT_122597 [Guillardia theta CCMP2712]EKX53386.1 hypothetical protein GUITHDRAFT_101089 [Guillardia theta CCMP2712]|eukprot:XP_005818180.1 hypothetical protein GUITHDRAFT_122597 [Guillardia theta CCMP2712]